MDRNLLNQMRSVINLSMLSDKVRWVIAGSHHLLQDIQFRGSTLWGTTEKKFLMAFDAHGMEELMRSAEFLERTDHKSAITLQCGGHPFIGQYLLYHLWERQCEKPSYELITNLIRQMLIQEMGTLNSWKEALGPQAIRVYRAIDNQNGMLSEDDILRRINEPGDQVKSCLLALACHALIIQEDWLRYRIGSQAFKTWIDRYG